jgi:hypothetical protein
MLGLSVFFLFALLAGCIKAPAECRTMCGLQAEACKNTCRNNCSQCRAFANKEAAMHFGDYLHEKVIKEAMIARVLKSYRDPLQCRKVTCNCKADYGICIQACTGVIQKNLRVPHAC